MALDFTDEQKRLGAANFREVSGELTRRNFMKSMAVAGGAVALAAPAAYFGYQRLDGKPVKAALIGCGDEGGVLVGEHNPEYLEFVAVCDIRPSNKKRIYDGEKAPSMRKGLKFHYGAGCESSIRHYTDYKEMLEKEKELEAVVIATPLVSHAPIAIDCLNAGKHVLCEKLMARTIGQCKEMIRAAEANNRILAVGHQRHYSLLYAQATDVIANGVLGEVRHIRALWHRNFTWPLAEVTRKFDPDTGEPIFTVGATKLDEVTKAPLLRDGWTPPLKKEDVDALKDTVRKYGYKDVNELVRWRLYNRTGGGLMAELGSHQLDACSIFLGKVHPLSVTGVGTHSFYGRTPGDGKPNPREIDDHVFVTFEFPGKSHPKGPNGGGKDEDDVVVVTYSSISTNAMEEYGECVMGNRATMVVEREQNVMLYPEKDPNRRWTGPPRSTTASISSGPAGKPVVEAGPTWGGPSVAVAGPGAASAPVSRGYREEMEDFAYCVKLWGQGSKRDQRLPRCHGTVAMADAIIALTANVSMKDRRRIEFDNAWFDPANTAVPDASLTIEKV